MTNQNKILIIIADFYEDLAEQLITGAKGALEAAGADYDIVTVPGALEVPGVIAFDVHGAKQYAGYVTLGVVIRGQTGHYDMVCDYSFGPIQDLVTQHGLAVGHGILTVENREQAEARANPAGKKNMGGGAAKACLNQIKLKQQLAG